MKKSFKIGLIIISIFLFGFTNERYEIGAILPLTGAASSEGQFLKQGIDLAVKEINNEGGIQGKELSVAFQDSKYSAKDGISSLQFLKLKKIPITISAMSSVSNAISSYITSQGDNEGPVVFVTSSSAPGVTGKNDWVYRTFLLSKNESKTMAEFMVNKLNKRKVAVYYINDDYGLGAFSTFKAEVEKLGGKVVWSEGFNKDNLNHRSSIAKLKQVDTEALYIVGQDKTYASALKQIKENNLNLTILTTIALSVPEWQQLIGEKALEGIYYTDSYYNVNSNDPEIIKFIDNYNKQFHEQPNVVAAFSYSVTKIIYQIIKDGENNPVVIKERIKKINNFVTPIGAVSIKNYESDIPARIMIFKNGKSEDVVR